MRVISIVGARPQFVKASVIGKALRDRGIEELLVHTGQHYDERMSDIFFEELELAPPAYHLGIHGGHHGNMTGRMLTAIEDVLLDKRPDCLIIIGDTNSTLAGALAAAKLHIPVAHVEAGLRSFNRRMPEEINRVLSDHLSALLFCSTNAALVNLANEGISKGVYLTGDVMMDATMALADVARDRSDILRKLNLTENEYALSTIHRAENTNEAYTLGAVVDWLEMRAKQHPVVLPLHPRTKAALEMHGIKLSRVRGIEPVGYLDMQRLLSGCTEVFTDSGGLQKEAYFHRKPCVTLRDETEWVETIECGWNRLWHGPDYAPRREITEYGGGRAAQRVAEILSQSEGNLRG
ncbi:MAG: non-hydrolyzing UDP-N-acetylglucosamine 2-epimerase [Rhizomicrobium sp.]